jgi:hypothetical protein
VRTVLLVGHLIAIVMALYLVLCLGLMHRELKRRQREFNPSNTLRFWNWTGFFGIGHVTYAPGVLAADQRNPARMIEDIMGHDPAPTLLDGRSESEFYAAVWMHAGWWDRP